MKKLTAASHQTNSYLRTNPRFETMKEMTKNESHAWQTMQKAKCVKMNMVRSLIDDPALKEWTCQCAHVYDDV